MAPFRTVTDKDYDSDRLNSELQRLRNNGLVLPRHSGRAAQSYGEAVTQTRAIQKAAGVDLDNLSYSVGKTITSENLNSPEVQSMLKENQSKMQAMGQKRNLSYRMQRTSASVTPGGTDAQNAIPRFYDPLEYWDLSGLPWNVADEGHRHKLHKWLRLYYATHYLVPTLIDIFTRFPLIGIDLECFDGDTRVLTRKGTQSIEKLSGTEHELLNGRGQWQKVPVESHGLRDIWEIRIRRNKREKIIRTTENHRWLLESNRATQLRSVSGPGVRKELVTSELRAGDKLASCFPINQIKKGGETHPSSFGVAHGFTFGDGSRASSGGGCFVELNGPKDQALTPFFPNPVYHASSHPDAARIAGLPAFFKDRPSIDEGVSYLYGWLAGYFAADGTVSKKGAAYLDSANQDDLQFVRDVCTRLGIKTTAEYIYTVPEKSLPQGGTIKDWKGYRLPIDMGSLTQEFFILSHHKDRYITWSAQEHTRNEEWIVVSVQETDEEDMVYCATVEGSESFVLEDNILTGNCKDHALTDIYEEIFLRNLKYDEFFVGLGREYWTVGEAFPLGSFDEDLGVWEHEELINPEDVVIDNFPFLNTQQLKIVPPDYLRRIAQTKSPAREWYLLQEQYADLIPYLLKGEHIPISPVMIRQVANKMNNWDDHGTPILLRGLRTLLYEEKLLASQEAIAERLYSPLILAKLGIMDMGEGLPPWIPTPAELESVRDDLDIALASDFRLMVHHFGLDITSVFGREQMPRLGDDFDRIERRIMQVFGVNPSLLSAGSNSQPYASSALQAEFMNQILKTFQNMLKSHYRERALVVAEAQGHQDYEKKGQTRVPIYERVVVYDEEGNKEIKEVPKLLVPDLTFASFDLRDEATERQFLMELRQMGVPLPNADLLIGVDWKYKDKIDEYNTELKEQTIAQQQTKMETYYALTIKGLPVPLDLKAECESVLIHGPGAGGGAPQGAQQGMGGPPPGGPGAGAPPGGPGAGPGGEAIVMPPAPPGLGSGPGTAPPGGGPPPASPMAPGPAGSVPQVSNERRPGLTYNTSNDGIMRFSAKEGSDFDQYMSERPEYGLAFVDYIIDNHKRGSLEEVPNEELENLAYDWPAFSTMYQQRVAQEIGARLATLAEGIEEDATLAEPEKEFVLKSNQELQKTASGVEKIVEIPSKKKVKIELAKKYAIIDALATDLSEDDKASEQPDNAEPKPS